ncbi:MAG: hypothetical protein WA631_02980, partial [Nitrososphaeraceae archaeon]
YIEQPGNGAANHTQQFNDGYAKGWCSIMGPNSGKETDAADFECEMVLGLRGPLASPNDTWVSQK